MIKTDSLDLNFVAGFRLYGKNVGNNPSEMAHELLLPSTFSLPFLTTLDYKMGPLWLLRLGLGPESNNFYNFNDGMHFSAFNLSIFASAGVRPIDQLELDFYVRIRYFDEKEFLSSFSINDSYSIDSDFKVALNLNLNALHLADHFEFSYSWYNSGDLANIAGNKSLFILRDELPFELLENKNNQIKPSPQNMEKKIVSLKSPSPVYSPVPTPTQFGELQINSGKNHEKREQIKIKKEKTSVTKKIKISKEVNPNNTPIPTPTSDFTSTATVTPDS